MFRTTDITLLVRDKLRSDLIKSRRKRMFRGRIQDKKSELIFFNQIPQAQYDTFYDEYYEERLELFGLNKRATQKTLVLDAACGSGAWGIRIAKYGYSVIGVDISETLVNNSKKWSSEQNARFSSLVADLEYLPFKSESFGICFCGGVLHHFPDLKSIVEELSSIVREKGQILLVEPNGTNPINRLGRVLIRLLPPKWVLNRGIATPNERLHTTKAYVRELKSNGFTDFQVIPRFEIKHIYTPKDFMTILVAIRELLFRLLLRFLPLNFSGTQIFIIAVKNSTKKEKSD